MIGSLLITSPGASSGQEVFAWFSRDLLPVNFEAGDWVRYALEEIDEAGPVTDTLTVTVLRADSSEVWFELESGESQDFVALDPDRLDPGSSLLDALVRVVHTTDQGLVDEDVAELRESALAQRHFADPFEDPVVRREALPDTTFEGLSLSRERIELREERREPAGPYLIVTTLRARAEVSPDLPLIGLLHSWTSTVVTTEAKEGGRGARRPPLVTEHTLECIGFGTRRPVTMPDLPLAPD